MPRLTKAQILQSDDLPVEDVPVDWGPPGATVGIRTLTGAERDAFVQLITDRTLNGSLTNLVDIKARLVVLTAIDDDDERVFEDTPEDLADLQGKSSRILDELFDVAQRINALGEEVEEIAGNLPGEASRISGTSSP